MDKNYVDLNFYEIEEEKYEEVDFSEYIECMEQSDYIHYDDDGYDFDISSPMCWLEVLASGAD